MRVNQLPRGCSGNSINDLSFHVLRSAQPKVSGFPELVLVASTSIFWGSLRPPLNFDFRGLLEHACTTRVGFWTVYRDMVLKEKFCAFAFMKNNICTKSRRSFEIMSVQFFQDFHPVQDMRCTPSSVPICNDHTKNEFQHICASLDDTPSL